MLTFAQRRTVGTMQEENQYASRLTRVHLENSAEIKFLFAGNGTGHLPWKKITPLI